MNAARIILAACIALVCGPGVSAADAPAAPTRDVLIDVSHEWPGPLPYMPFALGESGIGTTDSHAYLASLRDKLADYKLIILWQHARTVPYDDLEYGVLLDYVKGGGRLLLVSNAPRWMKENRADNARDYPILKLARRLGLRLNKEHEELALGAGKVIHQHYGADVALRKVFSAKREERREAAAFIEGLMSGPRTGAGRAETIEPEIPIKEGGVALLYAQPMKEGGAWARKALPQVVRFVKESLRAEPEGVVLRGVPCNVPMVMTGFQPEVPLLAEETDRTYALTVALFQGWMQPPGGRVSYPRWVDTAWATCLGRDALRRFNILGRYAKFEKTEAECFKRLDPNMAAIDLAGPVPDPEKDAAASAAYNGKCEYVFRALVKEHGPQAVARFRDLVVLYRDAGKLPQPMTSPDAVRLLSLAAGKDLFPWFRSLGMKVEPVAIDFAEPDRLRLERAAPPPVPAP